VSFDEMRADADPDKINAVVLLTDGRNEDPRNNDLEGLLRGLTEGSRASSRPCGSSRSPTAATPTRPSCGASPRRPTPPPTTRATRAPSTAVFTAVISNF
jgi:hypothetical protein